MADDAVMPNHLAAQRITGYSECIAVVRITGKVDKCRSSVRIADYSDMWFRFSMSDMRSITHPEKNRSSAVETQNSW